MSIFKKSFVVICTFALVVCLFVLPVSASNVQYDDVAEKFVFIANSQENPDDLFEKFKNAMPGDVLTQEIVLENKDSNRMYVKFFLKALETDETVTDFLSKLSLTVKEKDGSPFFVAPADQTADLTDWVELGTVAKGGKITLQLTLSIPLELDNTYQEAMGKIVWAFKSEEQPIETNEKHRTPVAPVMGDNSSVVLWASVLGVALVGLTATVIVMTRKKKKD